MGILNTLRRFKDRINIFLSYWKVSKDIHDFDYSSILYAELHQMKRVRYSIEKYHTHINWEQTVSRIKLAEKILEMFIFDDWWSINFENNNKYELPYINTNNYKRFIPHFSHNINEDCFKQFLYEEKLWNLYCLIRKNYTRNWWD